MTFQHPKGYGIALLNKPLGKTSFHLVSFLRKLTQIRCIGHAGTLDPFATGVMVLLVGKPFTKLSNQLITVDKEYTARILLGSSTDSFDLDGTVTATSSYVPTREEIEIALEKFQGNVSQLPPMFSAKKINGQKLYDLARKGLTVERATKQVFMQVTLLDYQYPYIDIHVRCSSGTYIRTIAYDLSQKINCEGHLIELTRTRLGPFKLNECQNCESVKSQSDLNLRQGFENFTPAQLPLC